MESIGLFLNIATLMNDRIFLNRNTYHGDDLLLPWHTLAQSLEQQGVQIRTSDMLPLEAFDGFLFLEMPERNNPVLQFAIQAQKPRILLIVENLFAYAGNLAYSRYAEFDAVLTYDEHAVVRGIADKLNYAFDLPMSIDVAGYAKREKLACMIFGARRQTEKHFIYHRRLQTILFYEKKHPSDFDLYGRGWGQGSRMLQASHPQLHRRLRKICYLPKIKHPSWKGEVLRKREVISKYRFCYCYENTMDIPGYITEKMFDVMMAGTVPIYLGHSDVSRFIPATCFINRDDFGSESELYQYISSMDETQYLEYVQAIHDFLLSDQSYPFSNACFSDTIKQKVLKHVYNR